MSRNGGSPDGVASARVDRENARIRLAHVESAFARYCDFLAVTLASSPDRAAFDPLARSVDAERDAGLLLLERARTFADATDAEQPTAPDAFAAGAYMGFFVGLIAEQLSRDA